MNAVPRAVSPTLLPTAARHHLQPRCTVNLCLPPHLRLPLMPLPMAALKAAALQCAMFTASRRGCAPPLCLSPCHCLLLPMAAHLMLPPRAELRVLAAFTQHCCSYTKQQEETAAAYRRCRRLL